MGVYEKIHEIGKEKGTVYSHRDTDDLLKNVPSEFDKYVFDKELQYTDYFTFASISYN